MKPLHFRWRAFSYFCLIRFLQSAGDTRVVSFQSPLPPTPGCDRAVMYSVARLALAKVVSGFSRSDGANRVRVEVHLMRLSAKRARLLFSSTLRLKAADYFRRRLRYITAPHTPPLLNNALDSKVVFVVLHSFSLRRETLINTWFSGNFRDFAFSQLCAVFRSQCAFRLCKRIARAPSAAFILDKNSAFEECADVAERGVFRALRELRVF